jgi:predicted GH43/DUF377 family glycosyl hydrolase
MTTLVTAWIPTARQPHHSVRELDEYVLLARSVFALGFPVIAFVHESIEIQLAQLAGEIGVDVCFVPTVSHSTSPERAQEIGALIGARKTPDVMSNLAKDETSYISIQLSKADWLVSASEITKDEDLWWIDLGLAHVSPTLAGQVRQIPNQSECVIACDERVEHQLMTLDLSARTVYERNWPVAAGGMFGVRSTFVKEFRDIWWDQVDQFIANQIAPTDELILSQIALHDARAAKVNGTHQNLFESFGNSPLDSGSKPSGSASTAASHLTSLISIDSAHITNLSEISGWEPGWSCFNPSIATDDSGKILCLVRSSNYTVDGYEYTIFDDSGAIKTRTQCLTLDSEFNILDLFWIADPEIVTSAPQFPVHGIEDMRLSFDGMHWIVTGTIRQHDPKGYCRQVIAKLNLDSHQLDDVHIMPSPIAPWKTDPTRIHEKNWLTLKARDHRHDLVWSADPLVILEWDWVTQSLGPKTGKPAVLSTFGLRGSTPFIATPLGQLGLVHEVSRADSWPDKSDGPSRRYTHRFVLINEEVRTSILSGPFSFVGEGLEYAAGIALIDSRIVISFGQNDQTAHLVEIHLSEVEKLLNN